MKIVNENVKDQLTARNLRRFNHPEEDKKKLNEFIIKKKSELLYKIATDLIGLWSIIEDDDNPELSKALLKLVILDCPLSDEQLDAIYNIDPVKTEIDHQLKEALATLAIPEEHRQPTYEAIFKFRHMYFLDKPFSVRPNPLAFPERLSERALNGHYNRIALYFKQEHRQTLPKEEQQLLDLFYPEVQLRKKIVRREANLDITVEPNTIQSFIYNAFKRVFDQPSSAPIQYPLDNFDMAQPLPPQLQKQQDAYTNEPLFKLLDQPEALRTTLAKDKSAINKINYHDRRTLLMEAVLRQDETLVKLLIDAGADVNLSDCTGYTALHLAAEGKNQTIFDLILAKANAKTIDFGDQGDYTPMYIAAEAGHVNYVKALLDKGADPNLQDKKWGNTVLHIAVRNNQTEVVAELLRHPKTDRSIQDKSKEKKTAEDLIKNEARLKPLAELFNKYPDNKRTSSTLIPTQTLPTKASGIAFVQTALLDPLNYQAYLGKFINYPRNLFLEYAHTITPTSAKKIEMQSFALGLESEKQRAETVKKFFQEIQKELKEITADQMLSFAQKYNQIYLLYKKVITTNMSATAFAFELVRSNNYIALTMLQNNLLPMQVAIDQGRTDAIRDIFLQQPDREKELIPFKGKLVSELSYAMINRKTNIVQFIEAEIQAKRIKMAAAETPVAEPDLAKSHLFDIESAIQNLPATTLKNWENLLKNLQDQLAPDQSNIIGLFIPDEFDFLQILLGEPQDFSSTAIPERQLEYIKEKMQIVSSQVTTPIDKKICTSSSRFVKSLIHFTNDLTAFNNAKQTLNCKLNFGIDDLSSGNTNPSQCSHLVNIAIDDAISKKIIAESDIFYCIKIHQNKHLRTNLPIKFIGENTNIVTIFSVYQNLTAENKPLIYCRFDYHENGKIKFPPAIYTLDLEHHSHAGDIDKYFAYLFLYILRGIKGKFSSGSYYHYILKNKYDSQVINSATNTILNNIFISGNISKPITIDNDAVNVQENPNVKMSEEQGREFKIIEEVINEDKLDELKKLIKAQKISKDQLKKSLEFAITKHKVEAVKYLLELGVTPDKFLIMNIFRDIENFHLLDNTRENYYLHATQILELLLLQGCSDEKDPDHIRHLSSTDSYNLHSSFRTSEEYFSPHGLNSLQTFEQTDIAELFINALHRDLDQLYEHSFVMGLFEAHLKIANRLQKPSLFDDPRVKSFLRSIDEGDLVTFEKNLNSPHSNTSGLFGCLFFYALRAGNQKAIEIAFSKYKKNLKIMQLATVVAIKYHAKDFLLKVLTESELQFTPLGYYWIILLNYSVKHIDQKYTTSYLNNHSDLGQICSRLLEYKHFKLVKFILDNCNVQISETLLVAIMSNAVQAGDIEIFKKLLLRISLETSPVRGNNWLPPLVTFVSKIVSHKDPFYLELILDMVTENKFNHEFGKFILKNSHAGPLNNKNHQNYLESFFAAASPACLKVILKFMAKIKSKEYKSRSAQSTCNYLHLVLRGRYLENIKLMQSAFPDLSLITPAYDNVKLFKQLVESSRNSTAMLEEVLSMGIPFPTKLSDKIAILSLALQDNLQNIISWLFKKKFLSPEEQEPNTKRNILQLLFYYFSETIGKNELDNNSWLIPSFTFLVDIIGVDINHRDIDNRTILLYPLATTGPNSVFMVFVTKVNSDWTVVDNEGNTPLHVNSAYLTSEWIDLFHKKGGNVKALNKHSLSILEHHALFSSPNSIPVKNKLLQYGCSIRPALIPYRHSFSVITCSYNNKLYLLINTDHVFIFNDKLFKLKDYTYYYNSFPIEALHKHDCDSLPSIKKMSLNYDKGLHWIPMPESFSEEEVSIIYDDTSKIAFKLNRFAKALIKFLTPKFALKSISINEENKILKLYQDEFLKIRTFYETVLSGELEKVQSYISQNPSFLTQVNHFAVPLSILQGEETLYSKEITCFSPLNAAIILKHQTIVEYLLTQGCTNQLVEAQDSISLAIIYNNVPVIITLLKIKQSKFSQLNLYKTLDPRNPQKTCLIFEALSCYALSLHTVNMSKSELTQKQIFITSLEFLITTTQKSNPEIDLTTLLANLNHLKALAQPTLNKLPKHKRTKSDADERPIIESDSTQTKKERVAEDKKRKNPTEVTQKPDEIQFQREAHKQKISFFRKRATPHDEDAPSKKDPKKSRADEDDTDSVSAPNPTSPSSGKGN